MAVLKRDVPGFIPSSWVLHNIYRTQQISVSPPHMNLHGPKNPNDAYYNLDVILARNRAETILVLSRRSPN